MLAQNNIKPSAWSLKKSKRLGRWNGSGKWTYSGRWCKWQNARSGGWVPQWFEWGQTPLFRRMPKLKWFSNSIFKKEYNILNLKDLEKLANDWVEEISKEILLWKNLLGKKRLWIKILWKWELTKKIFIKADKVSASAKEAIEKAWGKVEIL